MPALARLSLLKSSLLLNELTTTFDDALKALLIQTSNFVDVYTQRRIENSGSLMQTTYTSERYTGNDTHKLWLKNWPITSVTDLSFWDGDDSYDTETSTIYEVVRERYIFYPKLGQASNASQVNFKSTFDNGIEVTYVAGYDVTSTWRITDVVIGAKTFTVAGDHTGTFVAGLKFGVTGSTGNDGTFTVVSSAFGVATVITVTETISDATVDGSITAAWDTDTLAATNFGVPDDLEQAVARIAMLFWLDGKGGDARLGMSSKTVDIAGTVTYDKFLGQLPPDLITVFNAYKAARF